MKELVLLLFSVCISPLFADVTISLDAGQLTGPNGNPSMVPDNNYGSINGSLLLILDEGSSGTVDNTLTSGSYVSGTNLVLGAGGFNTNSGNPNETTTTFYIPNSVLSAVNPGDDLALRWFPQISLAEFESGTLPAAGDYFGSYSPNGGNPDGGDAWTLPSSGLINLNFNTVDDLEDFQPGTGGTQPDSAGFAAFQVTSSESPVSAPEPSTSLLLLLGFPVLVWAVRRQGVIGTL